MQQVGGGEEGYGLFWGKGLCLQVQQLQWRLECAKGNIFGGCGGLETNVLQVCR